jgi:hypothetical protein
MHTDRCTKGMTHHHHPRHGSASLGLRSLAGPEVGSSADSTSSATARNFSASSFCPFNSASKARLRTCVIRSNWSFLLYGPVVQQPHPLARPSPFSIYCLILGSLGLVADPVSELPCLIIRLAIVVNALRPVHGHSYMDDPILEPNRESRPAADRKPTGSKTAGVRWMPTEFPSSR